MRIPIWITMPLEDKMTFLLHQNNSEQFELCFALLVEQHDPYFYEARKIDKKLEDMLDRLIYRKYIWLCKRQSLKQKRKAILMKIQKSTDIRDKTYDTIRFLHNNISVCSNSNIYYTFFHL